MCSYVAKGQAGETHRVQRRQLTATLFLPTSEQYFSLGQPVHQTYLNASSAQKTNILERLPFVVGLAWTLPAIKIGRPVAIALTYILGGILNIGMIFKRNEI